MHVTGCLGLVHWDDPEGWYGEVGGRGLQDGEHVYTCAGSSRCEGFSPVVVGRGYSVAGVHELLIEVASCVAEYGV